MNILPRSICSVSSLPRLYTLPYHFLAHPKVKLFIGHGGALGVNEAVYEGVPILGIPLYADQTLNLKVLERHGAAEILEYTDINDETVSTKLTAMLNDAK